MISIGRKEREKVSELKRVNVCSAEDLKPGQRQLVKADRSETAILNINGQLYAVRNKCPHQGSTTG